MGRVRRGLLGVALVGAGALAVTGCGSSSSNANDLAAGKQKFTELCAYRLKPMSSVLAWAQATVASAEARI